MKFDREKVMEVVGFAVVREPHVTVRELEAIWDAQVAELREKVARLKSPDTCSPPTHIFKIDALALIDGHQLTPRHFGPPTYKRSKGSIPRSPDTRKGERRGAVMDHRGIHNGRRRVDAGMTDDRRKQDRRG